jgi:hypothetical protein
MEKIKETLEEAAHKMLVDYGIKSMGQSIGVLTVKKLMVDMAQWQAERMYSEEEVKEMITDAINSCTDGVSSHYQDFEEWFEENKKK